MSITADISAGVFLKAEPKEVKEDQGNVKQEARRRIALTGNKRRPIL